MAKKKGFKRFHTSKNVGHVTPFCFYERYKTKNKKTQCKINQPGDVFPGKLVEI